MLGDLTKLLWWSDDSQKLISKQNKSADKDKIYKIYFMCRIKEGEPIYRDAGSISILQEVGMICLLNVEFFNIVCMKFLCELVINDSLMFFRS